MPTTPPRLPGPVKAALRRANHEILRLRADLEGRGEHDEAIDRALERLEGRIARKQQGNPYHDAQGHFTNPAGVGHAGPKGEGKARGRRARLGRLKRRFKRQRGALKARHRSERKAMRDRHRSERKAASPSHRESTAAYHREERERLATSHRGERADLRAKVRERADAIKSSGRGAKAEPARDLADADPKAVESAWNELGDHWRQSLSPKERTAAEQYTGRYFEGVNNLARKGKVGKVSDPNNAIDDAKARAILADTDTALAKAKLPAATVVYRGAGPIARLGVDLSNPVGTVIRDKGFLSTSLTPKVAHAFTRGADSAILRITAPKGSPGISMTGLSSIPREREVLFARGASLRITGASKDPEGRRVLDAELFYEGSHAAARAIDRARPDGDGDGDGTIPGGSARSREEIKFGWADGDVEVIPPGEAARSIARASEGNPNHKGKGPGGGQFTSGPGGGGSSGASDKPHGKHWAKRQRRKKRKTRPTRKPGQAAKNPQKTTTSGRKGVDTRVRLTKSDAPRIKDQARAERAKATEKRQTAGIQRYSEGNEDVLISKLGGTQGTDNGAVDVVRRMDGKTHGIEVKTIVNKGGPNKSGSKAQIKCEADQKARKEAWKSQAGDRELHTVVYDHRDRAVDPDSGEFIGNKEAWSGHVLYYRRGVGPYTLGGMHPVKSYAELKSLMAMDAKDLPPKARPPELKKSAK